MKKFILLLSLLVSINCFSQIFVTFDPTTFAVGGAISYNISNTGIYSTLSTTKISEGNCSTNCTKASIGITMDISNYSKIAFGYTKTFINNPFKVNLPNKGYSISLHNIKKHSFEVGFIISINKKVSTIVLTDPINWQTQVGIGISFN